MHVFGFRPAGQSHLAEIAGGRWNFWIRNAWSTRLLPSLACCEFVDTKKLIVDFDSSWIFCKYIFFCVLESNSRMWRIHRICFSNKLNYNIVGLWADFGFANWQTWTHSAITRSASDTFSSGQIYIAPGTYVHRTIQQTAFASVYSLLFTFLCSLLHRTLVRNQHTIK